MARTPCVGICSTTYGDLVCRGCKRFAHEIVSWNTYDDGQRDQIWQRLHGLRDQVTAHLLMIENRDRLKGFCLEAGLEALLHDYLADAIGEPEAIYEVLSKLVIQSQPLAEAGLSVRQTLISTEGENDSLGAIKAIDHEVYSRSQAHYEHNFKVIA
ncbi:MAG: DUF1289 domain-containing protein [Pseudomonadota bacterium]